MPRADHELTIDDVLWLAEMDRAMQAPRPAIAIEQYCAALDANDYVTRENYRLRQHRKKLLRAARRIQKARRIGVWVWLLVVAMAFVLGKKVGQ